MKKLNVNKDTCIGCGACQATIGEVFEINDDGLAEAKTDYESLTNENKELVNQAIENCPTGAITLE